MITKEQALTATKFIQTRIPTKAGRPYFDNGRLMQGYCLQDTVQADKVINWRANGRCQTWKTRPDEFKLPIKHGLRDCSYITNTNAHLFEVVG